ncbi:MAG: hypothetical protein HY710_10970 [Candidatus Latescibacteria bacterium]|nr:hypothetical protein [Candidatus Latescibacterota bacterium]
MAETNIKEIYKRYIKPLSIAEQLRLVVMIANDLTIELTESAQQSQHPLKEQEGKGQL